MIKRFFPHFSLFLSALMPSSVWGQVNVDAMPEETNFLPDAFRGHMETEDTGNLFLSTDILSGMSMDSLAAYESAQIAYYTYLEGALEHRAMVFQWQMVTSVVIFFLVILIVFIGLYFSWIQFKEKGPDGADSTIELGASGVKITSSILGVLILTISLAFFYLYLVHVYPIFEVF